MQLKFNILSKRKIKPFDIVIFLRQFATLISAGIPIRKSLEILEKSQSKVALNLLIHKIKQDISAGQNLYSCFKRFPQYFDELTCQMIHVGERSGKLETILVNVATNQENQLQFKRKIKQALFYPGIIMLTAMLVSLCMMLFIIPRFAELFHAMQDKLPLFTRIVFILSANLNKYIWFVAIVLISISAFMYLSREKSASMIQTIAKHVPYIKTIFRKIILVRFCRNLAITFSSGIPISEALQLSAKINNDLEFSTIIAKLRSKVHAGLELNRAMESIIYFPLLMVQMIKIGEESGLLEQMLNKVADFFETDIDQFTHTLTQTLEPLIILILGVVIGGLVIAMYLPIFKLGNIM